MSLEVGEVFVVVHGMISNGVIVELRRGMNDVVRFMSEASV